MFQNIAIIFSLVAVFAFLVALLLRAEKKIKDKIKQQIPLQQLPLKPQSAASQSKKQRVSKPRQLPPIERIESTETTNFTKRKSLQPGNQGKIPMNFVADNGSIREFQGNTKKPIVYRFFGTTLEIKGRPIINGLTKRLHTMEILDGVFYVDGTTYKIHPNDIDQIIKDIRDKHD